MALSGCYKVTDLMKMRLGQLGRSDERVRWFPHVCTQQLTLKNAEGGQTERSGFVLKFENLHSFGGNDSLYRGSFLSMCVKSKQAASGSAYAAPLSLLYTTNYIKTAWTESTAWAHADNPITTGMSEWIRAANNWAYADITAGDYMVTSLDPGWDYDMTWQYNNVSWGSISTITIIAGSSDYYNGWEDADPCRNEYVSSSGNKYDNLIWQPRGAAGLLQPTLWVARYWPTGVM